MSDSGLLRNCGRLARPARPNSSVMLPGVALLYPPLLTTHKLRAESIATARGAENRSFWNPPAADRTARPFESMSTFVLTGISREVAAKLCSVMPAKNKWTFSWETGCRQPRAEPFRAKPVVANGLALLESLLKHAVLAPLAYGYK